MILAELFDTKYEYEIKDKSKSRFHVTKQIGDREIGIFFYRDQGNIWELIFAEKLKHNDMWSYKLSGSGSEFKVFAFVSNALKDFIHDYFAEVDELYCTTDSSRAKIYEKLLKKVNGFELIRNDKGDKLHPGKIILTLKKVNHEAT